MYLIRLTTAQRTCAHLKHPMFEGVEPVSIRELNRLTEERLNGGSLEPLTLALRSLARYQIGRFMWNHAESRRFLDEMVGEAMLAISMLVNNLKREQLEGIDIGKLACGRIKDRIEVVLNDLVSISAPCVRTQSRAVKSLSIACPPGSPCMRTKCPQMQRKPSQICLTPWR